MFFLLDLVRVVVFSMIFFVVVFLSFGICFLNCLTYCCVVVVRGRLCDSLFRSLSLVFIFSQLDSYLYISYHS